jgi:hypothetical protein
LSLSNIFEFRDLIMGSKHVCNIKQDAYCH